MAVWLYPRLSAISLHDLLPAFFCHLVVIYLTLILRDLHRQQLVKESLELRLDQEIQRCKSPHLCRNAATGGCRDELKDPSSSPRSRSMTPEDRGRSPTMQEKLARWPRVDSLEKERLSRV